MTIDLRTALFIRSTRYCFKMSVKPWLADRWERHSKFSGRSVCPNHYPGSIHRDRIWFEIDSEMLVFRKFSFPGWNILVIQPFYKFSIQLFVGYDLNWRTSPYLALAWIAKRKSSFNFISVSDHWMLSPMFYSSS